MLLKNLILVIVDGDDVCVFRFVEGDTGVDGASGTTSGSGTCKIWNGQILG